MRVGLVFGVVALGVGTASGLWAVMPEPTETAVTTVVTTTVLDAQADTAVRSNFESYRAALLAADGAAVPPLVSPATIDYYGELARLAAYAGPNEIAAKPIADRLTVARLRVIRTPAELAAMDGPGLLRLGVDEGLIDAESVRDVQLGDVRVDGDRAFAPILIGAEPSPVSFEFVQTGSAWKFDLVPTLAMANEVFSSQASEAGLAEDEFIFVVVELATGQPIDATIFDAP